MRRYLLILIPAFSFAPIAQAALGGHGDGVKIESTRLKARMQAQAATGYTIYEMTLSDGTVTKQFARSDGTIFAVSWNGHARPDLRTLFGPYFERFQADNDVKTTGRRRGPLRSDHADFIVRTFGRPGEVTGYAILPKLVPGGFDVQALQ
jgi:Protein of unknown function (DUF2844)